MIYIQTGSFDANRPRALFENLYTSSGAVVSGDAEADFPVSNALTGSTWDLWSVTGTGSSSATVTLTSQQPADCVFIGNHTFGTEGATVRVQYSTDGGGNWLNASDEFAPSDNSEIMIIFPERTGNAWRILRSGAPVSAGVIMIGSSLVFPQGVDGRYTSFQHGHRVELLGGNSIGGHFLGQKFQRRGGDTSIQFPLLARDFVDNDMSDFEQHYNDGLPFAFAANPQFNEDDVAYCWRGPRDSELRPTHFENGLYENFTMNVEYYVAS